MAKGRRGSAASSESDASASGSESESEQPQQQQHSSSSAQIKKLAGSLEDLKVTPESLPQPKMTVDISSLTPLSPIVIQKRKFMRICALLSS